MANGHWYIEQANAMFDANDPSPRRYKRRMLVDYFKQAPKRGRVRLGYNWEQFHAEYN